MFGSIKPLKGKERFQMAPDWIKEFYSLLRSIGTDIEPEGGLFRLTASQQAIDKFYGRAMEVKELPQSCELVFSPAFAARETAYQQGRFVKYMDLIQQLKIALVANMDPDDIMAIIGTRTTDAFPLIDYFKYIESKLAKVDINRKRNVRQQYRLIADGETFGAYRAFLTKHHQDIADTQAGVEVNEFDKFTNLADGIQPHRIRSLRSRMKDTCKALVILPSPLRHWPPSWRPSGRPSISLPRPLGMLHLQLIQLLRPASTRSRRFYWHSPRRPRLQLVAQLHLRPGSTTAITLQQQRDAKQQIVVSLTHPAPSCLTAGCVGHSELARRMHTLLFSVSYLPRRGSPLTRRRRPADSYRATRRVTRMAKQSTPRNEI